jgi:protoporphyrinogen/coproporphyrinogen III oxidase
VSVSDSTSRRIAVVGGGISGLSAARRAIELFPDGKVVLFESDSRPGGVISTLREDGFQVELSADNFITTVPWAVDLCKQLGLEDQLVRTDSTRRQVFVVRRGRMHPLPDGFLMMAPTRWWPLALTPILSPLGKLRAAMEYFLRARKDEADETMADFVRRRLGREAYQRLVEPLVGSIYAADLEKLSVNATLPQFREMELRSGSLIRAMRAQKRHRPNAKAESGARYSLFVTLRDGLSSLVDAIAASLPSDAVRLNSPVAKIERVGRKWRLWVGANRTVDRSPHPSPLPKGEGSNYTSPHPNPLPKGEGSFNTGPHPGPLLLPTEGWSGEGTLEYEDFDALILAVPAHVAATLLAPIDGQLGVDLARIEHSSTAVVSLGFDEQQIAHKLDGMGAVVPTVERSSILALSFSNRKYPHRAPEGKILLRAFVGGAHRPELAEMEDDLLLAMVLAEMAPWLGLSGRPCFTHIARWPRSMPQYHIGHGELIARIEARVSALPNFELAGNAYHGVGLPHCIHSGRQAAERLTGNMA